MRALVLLALTSCSLTTVFPERYRVPTPDCVSPCGMRLYGSKDCVGFAAAEARALRELEPIVGPMCERISRFRVSVLPGAVNGVWTDQWGRRVAGLTYCIGGIDLGTDVWSKSALAHEMVHAAECPAENHAHVLWNERGINAAIIRARQQ